MPAPVSKVTTHVMLAWCLAVTGTGTAAAQALCPEADARAIDAEFRIAPAAVTVEADGRGFGDTLPGGTWRLRNPGGVGADGLALEGVSFVRTAEPGFGSSLRTFDVTVDLRAWDKIVADLEFVVVDGERSLRLGALTGVAVSCETRSVSGTLSIPERDFASFFAGSKAPTLRVRRTIRTDGC